MGQKGLSGFKYKTNIVWIDKNVNTKENTYYRNSIKAKDCKNYEIFTFETIDDGLQFIKQLRYTPTYLILSGQFFYDFIKSFKEILNELFIIPKILIFCGNKKNLYSKYSNEYLNHKFYNSGKVYDKIQPIIKYFIEEIKINKKPLNENKICFPSNIFEFGLYNKIIPEINDEIIDNLNNYIFQNSNPNSKLEELFIQTIGVSNIPIQIIVKYYIQAYNLESRIFRNCDYYPSLIKLFQTAIENEYISNNLSDECIYSTILLSNNELENIKENFKKNNNILYTTRFLKFISSKNYINDRLKKSTMPFDLNSIILKLDTQYNNINLINLSSFHKSQNENYIIFPYTSFQLLEIKENDLQNSYIIELQSPEKKNNEQSLSTNENSNENSKEEKEEEGVFIPAESNFIEAFLCPISQDIMEDPVMTKYGHTYERSEIEKWIDKYHNDPLTKKPLEKSDLFPNYNMKNLIEEYLKLKNK